MSVAISSDRVISLQQETRQTKKTGCESLSGGSGDISAGYFSEVPEWMGLEKSQDDPTIVGLTTQVAIFQVQGEN